MRRPRNARFACMLSDSAGDGARDARHLRGGPAAFENLVYDSSGRVRQDNVRVTLCRVSPRRSPRFIGAASGWLDFLNALADRTVGGLVRPIPVSMPPGAEGSLPNNEFRCLAAYILQTKGYPSGSVGLDTNSAHVIGTSVGAAPSPPATSQPSASVSDRTGVARASERQHGDANAAPGAFINREVTTFTPVT